MLTGIYFVSCILLLSIQSFGKDQNSVFIKYAASTALATNESLTCGMTPISKMPSHFQIYSITSFRLPSQ